MARMHYSQKTGRGSSKSHWMCVSTPHGERECRSRQEDSTDMRPTTPRPPSPVGVQTDTGGNVHRAPPDNPPTDQRSVTHADNAGKRSLANNVERRGRHVCLLKVCLLSNARLRWSTRRPPGSNRRLCRSSGVSVWGSAGASSLKNTRLWK